MDLTKYKFPIVTGVDMMFPTFDTIPILLEEAKNRGFDHNHPYGILFSELFFKGGKVKFKENINEAFRKNAWSYVVALMGSYAPKHEDKQAVCAMILSEIVEPKLEPKD